MVQQHSEPLLPLWHHDKVPDVHHDDVPGTSLQSIDDALRALENRSWAWSVWNQSQWEHEKDEVHEFACMLADFQRHISDCPQWKVFHRLYQFEQMCSAKGGSALKFMLMFEREVDNLLDAPTALEVEHYSDKLRGLRGKEFGGAKLSRWGELQRHQVQPLNDQDVPGLKEFVIEKLNEIRDGEDGKGGHGQDSIFNWLTVSLKKSAMASSLAFLDSEWVARLHRITLEKKVMRWTGMGVIVAHLLSEGVADEKYFSHAKLNFVQKLESFINVLVPRFASQVRRYEHILSQRQRIVMEIKMRMMAGSLTGIWMMSQWFLRSVNTEHWIPVNFTSNSSLI